MLKVKIVKGDVHFDAIWRVLILHETWLFCVFWWDLNLWNPYLHRQYSCSFWPLHVHKSFSYPCRSDNKNKSNTIQKDLHPWSLHISKKQNMPNL